MQIILFNFSLLCFGLICYSSITTGFDYIVFPGIPIVQHALLLVYIVALVLLTAFTSIRLGVISYFSKEEILKLCYSLIFIVICLMIFDVTVNPEDGRFAKYLAIYLIPKLVYVCPIIFCLLLISQKSEKINVRNVNGSVKQALSTAAIGIVFYLAKEFFGGFTSQPFIMISQCLVLMLVFLLPTLYLTSAVLYALFNSQVYEEIRYRNSPISLSIFLLFFISFLSVVVGLRVILSTIFLSVAYVFS